MNIQKRVTTGQEVIMSVYEIIFKLALGAYWAGNWLRGKPSPAGLRTHTLVCVVGIGYGSFLDMYFQYYQTVNADGRIAAQVISGIGFRRRHHHARGATVRGLTTAAGFGWWLVLDWPLVPDYTYQL